MSSKIYIPEDIPESGKRLLKENGYDIVIANSQDVSTTLKNAADCDALLVRRAVITRDIMLASPKLKVIAKAGIGFDNIDLTAAKELGIYVTYAPESNINAVAEHTIMLMLAAAKKVIFFDRETRSGNYSVRNQVRGCDLQGQTLGFVGIGRIGTVVGKKASAGFEMKVICYDPFISDEKIPSFASRVDTIEEVFRQSNVVSLHLPATPQTRGIVCERLLSLMKPGAILINCARGDIINEKDLYETLRSGKIAGAAIDVFTEEPPPEGDPLFTLDNLIVTPHNAALTAETADRMGLHGAMGIVDVLKGVTPQWPVVKPDRPRQTMRDC
jgi:D-3-phosphoglycerate dehydrogenase